MEAIIQKAIEGGYVDLAHPEHETEQAITVLDPLFWQALGKACGWNGYVCLNCGYKHFSQIGFSECCQHWLNAKNQDRWQYEALRFHEINLTKSWSEAVKYLEDLVLEKAL